MRSERTARPGATGIALAFGLALLGAPTGVTAWADLLPAPGVNLPPLIPVSPPPGVSLPAPVTTVVQAPAGNAPAATGDASSAGGGGASTSVGGSLAARRDGASVLAASPLLSTGRESSESADSTPGERERRDPEAAPEDSRANRGARQMSIAQYVMTAQVEALADSLDADQAVFAGGGQGVFGWPEHFRVISQGFGCTGLRLAPLSSACPSGHIHTGDDIAGPDETEVMAADAGVVRIFRDARGYGLHVIETHGNGFATVYGHLHDVTVKDGDLVERGAVIGHEGSTGNSTGPHLHFEIRKDGKYLDPCPFLEDCGKPQPG